jgi:predicted DNA-binding ribbon-helix-helix protein
MMKTNSSRTVAKKSIVLDGHKTSVSMEATFWTAAKEIAAGRNIPLHELVSRIDKHRRNQNLSSAIRVFVLDYYKSRAAS